MRGMLGAVPILLGLVAAAPAPARAGCGLHGVADADHLGLELLSELGGLGSPGGDPADPAGRVPRCSGPTCSKAPAIPLAPGTASPGGNDLWCNTAAGSPPSDPDLAADLGEGAPLRPRSCESGIERPPRHPA